MLKLMKNISILSMLENQFLGSLKWLLLYSIWYEFFTLLVEMDTATVLSQICWWSGRRWFRWFIDVMRGNSAMVEFRAVCQHCRKQMIDYVSWDVNRETSEVHFKQEFFTLFVLSKHVCNGSWLDLNALELCNEI